MVAVVAILDFQHDFSYLYIYWSACISVISFDLIRRVVCKEMSKIDFPIGTSFAVFDLEGILLVQYLSTQIAQRFGMRSQKSVSKMVAMAAFLDFQSAWFSLFFIYTSTCCYTVSFNLIHLREDVQNRFSRCRLWQPSRISYRHDFSSFHAEVVLLLQSKFRLKRPNVWKETSKIYFQDDGCGFSISSALAILCLLGAPMLLIKFQLNWMIVFRGDVQNMNSQHFSHINV